MPTTIHTDQIKTALMGGQLFHPGLQPAETQSLGLLTILGGDGVIYWSNDSLAASPVMIKKDFSLADSSGNRGQGLFFDDKAELSGATFPSRSWEEFRWFVGTLDTHIQAEETATYGLPETSGGPNTVYNGANSVPTGNFYQSWLQKSTYTKRWWRQLIETGWGPGSPGWPTLPPAAITEWVGSQQDRTVEYLRYRTISSTYPWDYSEGEELSDSLSLLSTSDLTRVVNKNASAHMYKFLGAYEEDYVIKMLTWENLEFNLGDYVSAPTNPDPATYDIYNVENPPDGPGTDVDPSADGLDILEPTYMDFLTDPEDNGFIHRYHVNGTSLGSLVDNTPMTKSFFDAAAANVLTYFDPDDPKSVSGAGMYEEYAGPDNGWTGQHEVERRTGYMTYIRYNYTKEPYEAVFLGQKEISYEVDSFDLLNEAWDDSVNIVAFASPAESAGETADPIRTGGETAKPYRDPWGKFDAEGASISALLNEAPWTGQEVSEGETITVSKAWYNELKFRSNSSRPFRISATIERQWPVEREPESWDTYEYVFDRYESQEQTVIFTGTGFTQDRAIDCRTEGRHRVCFDRRDVLAPDVVQGSFTVRINEIKVQVNGEWKNPGESTSFYLYNRYRGGELFRYGGWVIEGEEGVWPNNFDNTELYPGDRTSRQLEAYLALDNIGEVYYILDETNDYVTMRVTYDEKIYLDDFRFKPTVIRNPVNRWANYQITISEDTVTDVGDGQEEISFAVSGIFPQMDETIREYESCVMTYENPDVIYESQVYYNYYDRYFWRQDNPNHLFTDYRITKHTHDVSPLSPA